MLFNSFPVIRLQMNSSEDLLLICFVEKKSSNQPTNRRKNDISAPTNLLEKGQTTHTIDSLTQNRTEQKYPRKNRSL